MDYNPITNKTNIKIYAKYGNRNPEERRHRCLLCNEPTSIDESFSDHGHMLVCRDCALSKFDSMWDVLAWIQGEEND